MPKERLNVAVVPGTYLPHLGGAQVFTHNLALDLQRRGHEPVLIVPIRSWWALKRSSDELPYPVVPLPPWQQTGLKASADGYLTLQDAYFSMLQNAWGFDVWQTIGAYPAGVGVSHFTSDRGIPHVCRIIGNDVQVEPELDYGFRRDPVVDRLVQRWLPEATRVISLTESVVEDCVSAGVPRPRVSVIGCAVDPDRFDDVPADRDRLFDRFDLDRDRFTFLAVGRNHPKKGFQHLVEAAEILDREGREIQVAFVGGGMQSLRDRVREAGIVDVVRFTGPLDPGDDYQLPPRDVIRFYKTADAVVFPTLLETFGNVNIEAMASGTPLITTDARGCRDIVTPGEDALQVPRGDPEALANSMGKLLEDPDLHRRLAKTARATVESRFVWDVIGEQYTQLYDELTSDENQSG